MGSGARVAPLSSVTSGAARKCGPLRRLSCTNARPHHALQVELRLAQPHGSTGSKLLVLTGPPSGPCKLPNMGVAVVTGSVDRR
jgi:hypothetical protein